MVPPDKSLLLLKTLRIRPRSYSRLGAPRRWSPSTAKLSRRYQPRLLASAFANVRTTDRKPESAASISAESIGLEGSIIVAATADGVSLIQDGAGTGKLLPGNVKAVSLRSGKAVYGGSVRIQAVSERRTSI